jgi:hypothetical protein
LGVFGRGLRFRRVLIDAASAGGGGGRSEPSRTALISAFVTAFAATFSKTPSAT